MSRLAIYIALSVLLSACGSANDTTDEGADGTIMLPIDMADLDPADEIAVDAAQTDIFQQSNPRPIGDTENTDESNITGLLIPLIFDTQTTVDLAYAQSGAALVEQLNESLSLPEDINVVLADRGIANAFFVPAALNADEQSTVAGDIFMCHELTEQFANFFGNNEQAFLTSTLVLMHELGHTLVDVVPLPVLGIEESYVDGIAAVRLGESRLSEGSVLAGWFFGSRTGTPIF